MKRERKLYLVPPPPRAEEEPKATADERARAEALRDALERGDDPLASALRAAFEPAPLDPDDLEAILSRALDTNEGEDAPPTRAEARAAARLADELERGAPSSDAAELAAALRAAYAPTALRASDNDALIEQAFAEADAAARLADELERGALESAEAELAAALRAAHKPPTLSASVNDALIARAFAKADARLAARPNRLRRIVPVTMAALSGVAAVAAAVALFVTQADFAPPGAGVAAQAALIPARSTEDLFDPARPFPAAGEESARIDRIASARASDLRKNRFAAWGVR